MTALKSFLPVVYILGFLGCGDDSFRGNRPGTVGCTSEVLEEGKIYSVGDRTYLWAGEDSSSHFDITGWSLNDCQLDDYGLDREDISALNYPSYKPVSESVTNYGKLEKVIVIEGEAETRIYPYSFLQNNEVVNEVIDGKPVMIVFCYLADLAAVYSREYCDKELTFAASGYTYSDELFWNGLSGFLLWDRETESLWWPLSDVAVSGHMKRSVLRKHDQDKWHGSTWGEVLEGRPGAVVLDLNQGVQEIPSHELYTCDDLACCE